MGKIILPNKSLVRKLCDEIIKHVFFPMFGSRFQETSGEAEIENVYGPGTFYAASWRIVISTSRENVHTLWDLELSGEKLYDPNGDELVFRHELYFHSELRKELQKEIR